MKKHYICQPLDSRFDKPLEFDWDSEAGVITGKDAKYILKRIKPNETVMTHPHPSGHKLSAEPLKSKIDMAAIIGYRHKLPDDLIEFYPAIESGSEEPLDDILYVY